LVGCNTSERPKENIVVVGSRTMMPLVRDIISRFQTRHSNVRFFLEPASPERTLADTRDGLADIGMLARPLRAEETGLTTVRIGREALALVIHRSNPVPVMGDGQISRILSRLTANWSEMGGSDRGIVLVGPGDGRAVRDVLQEYFDIRPGFLRPDSAAADSDSVLQSVASTPHALGWASLAPSLQSQGRLPIRLLQVGGEVPSLENAKAGKYPLVRPLLLLRRVRASERVEEFLEFAASEEVADLVSKHGFLGQ
jgi:phosphate transport system substrate-binding protein